MGQLLQMAGLKFGHLHVLYRAGSSRQKRALWRCRCDCGNEVTCLGPELKSGHRVSCGCHIGRVTHGHTRGNDPSPTFRSWKAMIGRCTLPSSAGFAHYQKLGITICDRWRSGDGTRGGFECFLADMGERPSLANTLDRYPDRAGNYEPDNCRWATRREQANNTSRNRLFEFQGEQLTCPEIARRTGLKMEMLRHRLVRAGWSVEEAISHESQPGRRRDLGR